MGRYTYPSETTPYQVIFIINDSLFVGKNLFRVFNLTTYQFIKNITISNYFYGRYLRKLRMFVYSTSDAKIYKCDENLI
jgi:hypothetical protein